MPNNNPYLNASNAYGSTAATTDQRSLEGKILLKSAMQLEQLATRLRNGETASLEEIGEVLEYNQKLWTLFVSETMNEEHPLAQDIKNNIASLGIFVFNRTKDILIDTKPDKFGALIDINRNIAAGLMKQSALPVSSEAPPPAKDSKTDNMA
jgi:flagellar protein FlaF